MAWPLVLVRLLHGWLGTRESTRRQRLAAGALNFMLAIKPLLVHEIAIIIIMFSDKVGHKGPQ